MFAVTTCAAMVLPVRYSRQLLHGLIGDTVVTVDCEHMLSVASGLCCEVQGSLVQSTWFAGEFIALDQDPPSWAEVRRVHDGHRLRVLCEGLRQLLAGRPEASGRFDLI